VQEPASPYRMFLAAHLGEATASVDRRVYSGQRIWLAVDPGDGSAVPVPVLVLRFNFEELEEPRDNVLVSVYISELAALYFYLPPSGIRGLFVVTRGVTREITRAVTRVMWDKDSPQRVFEVEPDLTTALRKPFLFRGRWMVGQGVSSPPANPLVLRGPIGRTVLRVLRGAIGGVMATWLLCLAQELLSRPARARPENPIRAALNVNACPPSPIVSSSCEVTVLIEGGLGSEVQTARGASERSIGELMMEAGIAVHASLALRVL
jgi:hypothetical protein